MPDEQRHMKDTVVDLGGGVQGGLTPPPLILGKKIEITEGRKAGRVSKITPLLS